MAHSDGLSTGTRGPSLPGIIDEDEVDALGMYGELISCGLVEGALPPAVEVADRIAQSISPHS